MFGEKIGSNTCPIISVLNAAKFLKNEMAVLPSSQELPFTVERFLGSMALGNRLYPFVVHDS